VRKKVTRFQASVEPPPPLKTILGTLSKVQRRRQRERHKTKGLMSRTMAVHVRFNFLLIS